MLTGCCQDFCLYRVDPPDDEQQACSKHVEAYYWNKLIENSASCWFIWYRYITMHGQQNINDDYVRQSTEELYEQFFVLFFLFLYTEPTNAQLTDRLLYCSYMFRYYCVIFRELSYVSKSMQSLVIQFKIHIFCCCCCCCCWISMFKIIKILKLPLL